MTTYVDRLNGEAGDDVISGGEGAYQLIDGSGLNIFYSGAGKDRIYVQETASGAWVRRPSDSDSAWHTSRIKKCEESPAVLGRQELRINCQP